MARGPSGGHSGVFVGGHPIPTPAPPPAGNTKLAEDEERQIEQDRRESEYHRDKWTRYLLTWCSWGLIVLLFVIAAAAFSTLGWHLVVPENWYWLEGDKGEEQLQKIKDVILSGAVVGLGTAYLRRYIEPS